MLLIWSPRLDAVDKPMPLSRPVVVPGLEVLAPHTPKDATVDVYIVGGHSWCVEVQEVRRALRDDYFHSLIVILAYTFVQIRSAPFISIL